MMLGLSADAACAEKAATKQHAAHRAMNVRQNRWKSIEVFLTVGDVDLAVKHARKSVELAERSEDLRKPAFEAEVGSRRGPGRAVSGHSRQDGVHHTSKGL